jgi:hypothetical protein
MQFAEKYHLIENIMALQITSELESSIHAGFGRCGQEMD